MSRIDQQQPDKENRSDKKMQRTDKPIPSNIYPVIDNDLARDNLENDLPAADLSEL